MKKTSYMILADYAVSKARKNLYEVSQVLDDYNSEYKAYDTGEIQDDIVKALRLLDKIEGAITRYGKNFHEE